MAVYECNEQQFIENIARLLVADLSRRIVVNRRVELHDDHRYGLAILPEQEFAKYSSICERKGIKKSVYAKVPFIDEFHNRFHDADEVLHSASNLGMPRLSIPYYRVEYSFSLWGNSYIYTFDVLFEPSIRIGKRRIPNGKGNKKGKDGKHLEGLIHILTLNQPDERMLEINLPKEVVVLDVKRMLRVIGSENDY